jgi:hypothetical protein
MVKVRTLVPLTHPTTGEQFAAGAEVDVAEEVFRDWRADGKASSIDDEQAQAKALQEGGSFSARTGRADVAGQPEEPVAEEEDKPERRRR